MLRWRKAWYSWPFVDLRWARRTDRPHVAVPSLSFHRIYVDAVGKLSAVVLFTLKKEGHVRRTAIILNGQRQPNVYPYNQPLGEPHTAFGAEVVSEKPFVVLVVCVVVFSPSGECARRNGKAGCRMDKQGAGVNYRGGPQSTMQSLERTAPIGNRKTKGTTRTISERFVLCTMRSSLQDAFAQANESKRHEATRERS